MFLDKFGEKVAKILFSYWARNLVRWGGKKFGQEVGGDDLFNFLSTFFSFPSFLYLKKIYFIFNWLLISLKSKKVNFICDLCLTCLPNICHFYNSFYAFFWILFPSCFLTFIRLFPNFFSTSPVFSSILYLFYTFSKKIGSARSLLDPNFFWPEASYYLLTNIQFTQI